jgi:hypothetical protein
VSEDSPGRAAVIVRTGCDGGVLIFALAPDVDHERAIDVARNLREASGLRVVMVADVSAVKAWHPHDAPAVLAAAMAETRELRALVAEMLRSFEGGSAGRWIARVSVRTLGKWRERAGLEG